MEPNIEQSRVCHYREVGRTYGGVIVRLKSSIKKTNGTCDEGEYRVELYSRRATLVDEFCLNKREHNIPDIEAAEKLLRQTMGPCDFASTTVSLICGEGTDDVSVLQFDHKKN
jgi:hypothetical protein